MNRPHSSGPDDPEPIPLESWPDPPEPSAARWEKVRSGIHARLPVRTPRKPWAAVMAVAGIAAAALVAVGVWVAAMNTTTPPTTPVVAVAKPEPVDPLAEYDVLPIASASDVMVSVVRGNDIQFGSINHPIPEVMPLMTGADVIVLKGTAGELSCPDPGGMAVYVMPSDK